MPDSKRFRLRLVSPLLLALLLLLGTACTTVDKATREPATPAQPTAPAEPTTPAEPATPVEPAAAAEPADFDATSADLEAVIPADPQIRIGTLENGLRYYLRANEKPEERAELRLAVNVGSVLEDPDQLGLAHFVEHMAFNGSEHFAKQELIDYLQGIGMRFGADINAYTGFDETVYRLTVPTDDPELLDTALLVFGDWAGRVAFEGEEIDKERGVVLEEWRRSQGAGMRLLDRQLPLIFAGSLYAQRLPIGTAESIENSTHEALRRFYEDWYRPDLMAVVAVGDFDLDRVEGLIREHLGDLENPENPRQRPEIEVPGHAEPRVSVETDPELTRTQVSVLYKHEAAETGTVADYRRDLAAGLYHQMLNARLQELTQAEDPPFVFAFSGEGALVRSAEVYQLDAMAREGEVERALEAVLTEVERVERHGFTQSELKRAKTEVLRAFEQMYEERDKQQSATLANEFVRNFLAGEPIPGIERERAFAERFVPEITLEEVNALGRRWITDENRVVLVSAPASEDVTLPEKDALLATFDAVAASEVDPWVDRTKDEPLLAEIPEPSPVVETRKFEDIGVTEWTLENGITVLLKPTEFQNDQVLLEGWSPGGTSLVSDENHVSATLGPFLLAQGGLGDFDLIELQKQLTGKVANATSYIAELDEGLNASASPKDLETMFQLLYLNATAPRLDRQAYTNMMQRMTAMLENRSKNPETVFRDEFAKRQSQGHVRRRPVDTELLQELDPDVALAVHQERFADLSDFTFVIVGNFEPGAIRPLVETYLGGLPTTDREESFRDVGIRPPEGVERFTVEKGLEPKSTVQLAFHGAAEWSRDERLRLLGLVRSVEIRLTELVREELGAAYTVGVRGALERWPWEHFQITVGFTCDPDGVDSTLDSIFEEFERFRTEGPSAEVVEKVKENLRRQRQVDLETNRYWSGALRFVWENDLDPSLILDYEESLDRLLDPESIREAANRYLTEDHYLLGVLRPEAAPASSDSDAE